MDDKKIISGRVAENEVHISRRGMLSLVSCVISKDSNQLHMPQSSRCVWPVSSRNTSNILSRRVYGKVL